MKNGQFPEVFNLGDLNGQNGFKLDGEVVNDYSGWSVSAAGDINSDGIADLLVGAYGHANGAGRSYVVFGGLGAGGSGNISLSGLNGANGFKLDGENGGDENGCSVSAAGDINGDGVADLLVGAYGHANYAGRSYVVFGGPTVGSAGVLALANLNGSNGFKLDGEMTSDYSGWSVSAAGDINGDGMADLLVGAWCYSHSKTVGRSYVVFGGPAVGDSGVLALASLNGMNGFKLDGEVAGDDSGYSVSAAGDINGDGVADLLVGSPGHASNTGRSYVVFGGPAVGNSGVLALSSLNGKNGFKLDGEAVGDQSGFSVSAAGDVNGDGMADLLVGCIGHASGAGRSYVVFGSSVVGNSGMLALASLNGKNGFKLDGEVVYDESGYSVSAAEDVNGDGVADLLVGVPIHAAHTGRSYVVFGGPVVGSSGVLALANLNGSNGFKLDGEVAGDYSGYSVSAAGDINGDGMADLLVGAPDHASYTGRSYVVFGDVPPVLVNNSLSLFSGENVTLQPGYISAYDRNHDNNTLVFIPSNVTHGYFSTLSMPIKPLENFTQSQIINNEIQFVHDSTSFAPSYDITVCSSGIAFAGPFPANITFILIENNQLVINQGQTVTLTCDNMQATYQNKIDGDLSFLVSDLAHGRFEFIDTPNQPILVFQQQNITDGLVRFVHDNSINAPAYQLAVSNGVITTPPQAVFIDFDTIPVLLANQLMINQGQSVRITSSILNATHPGMNDDSHLRFEIMALQQGQFSWISAPFSPITSFYQQNISDGLIQFIHDGSVFAPVYNVSVTDERTHSVSQAAEIDFDAIPILLNNTLRLNQGDSMAITSAQLGALHPTGTDDLLLFNITDMIHGQFQWVNVLPHQSISQFYQQNITDHQIQFAHDNSTIAPAYTVSVTDGRTRSLPQAAQIDFDPNPILVNNQLTISEDETVTLTSNNLLALHRGVVEPNLTFIISNVTNGRFIIANILETGNLTFLQQQILDQQVRFSQQGTEKPGYEVSVSDGRITLPPVSANITFYNIKPVLTKNQFLISVDQPVVLTSSNLAATLSGEMAQELQFLVSSVSHGHFERRVNPGVAIPSFYQKDVIQQSIQFVADDSRQLPECRLKAWDNTTGLASDIQETGVILIGNNNFRINQGDIFPITEAVLNATTNRGDDGDILFTPLVGAVQHGRFELVSNPNYPVISFQQKQITSHNVVFVSDNATSAPSAYLNISDGQMGEVQGMLPCRIDFDAAPTLINAYLATQSGRREQITDINLKASSSTAPVNQLMFEITDINHGYFADKNNWQVELLQFTQQTVNDGTMIFVTDQTGLAPQFKVSVWDGRMHCWACPQPADVVFDKSGPSDSSLSDIIRNAVIGAAASGVVGLLFFALKYKHSLSLQRNARPTIDGEAQETYSDALLLPIAREIFSRIKITGCLGYIGKRDYNEYMGAVSVLVAALENKAVIQPDHWNSLPRPQKQRIIDAIAMHTKELVGNNRCCSTRTFTSFYKAEATPGMIRNKAEAIANAVRETLSDANEAKSFRSDSGVRLTRTGSSLNQSQMQTPLLS